MTQLASDVARKKPGPGVWPDRIVFDFQKLKFIRPAGVVFLHNIIRWLEAKECGTAFRGYKADTAPLKYLHDALFFELHLEGKVSSGASRRATTQPLVEVSHKNSHAWIKLNLIPWISTQANVNIASLYGLQSSMAEIFNNILDHSRHDIGSVFGQYFPSEQVIILAISDMGLGIPVNVRKIKPELSDSAAIIQAVKEGFTTRSVPTNAGMGLDQLMRSVVVSLNGHVTIYSGKGMVRFDPRRGAVQPHPTANVGFCQGTTIEIGIDTRAIPYLSDKEEEELEW
jgi:hypothetical protein